MGGWVGGWVTIELKGSPRGLAPASDGVCVKGGGLGGLG